MNLYLYESFALPVCVCAFVCVCLNLRTSLNRAYEEHVLSSGALDERIFLGEGAREDIGTPGLYLCEGTENQDRSASILHKSLTVRQLHLNYTNAHTCLCTETSFFEIA